MGRRKNNFLRRLRIRTIDVFELTNTKDKTMPSAPSVTFDPLCRERVDYLAKDERKLVIRWGDRHVSSFHYVWLRDNCFCDECGAPTSQKRTARFPALPVDPRPATVSVGKTDLNVVWAEDGHTSTYQLSWLRNHCYSAEERARRRSAPVLWDKKLTQQLPTLSYAAASAKPSGQLQFLRLLRDYGFVLLRDVQTNLDEVLNVARLIGYPRESYYGTIFDIVTNADTKLLSGTNSAILPHTDEGWRCVPMGVILFHCLEASSDGGESILIDGFRVAEALREANPQGFDLLSRVPWQFHRHNSGEYNLGCEAKLISLDRDLNVVGFRFPFRFRAPLDISQELIEPVYAATRQLVALVLEERFSVRFRLQPGDVLVFDNHRLLHSRTEFLGPRHFRYCYVDRDDFHNKFRLLSGALGELDCEYYLPRGALA